MVSTSAGRFLFNQFLVNPAAVSALPPPPPPPPPPFPPPSSCVRIVYRSSANPLSSFAVAGIPILLRNSRNSYLQRSAKSLFLCPNSAGRAKTRIGAVGEGGSSSESAGVANDVVYQGAYGPWTVESSDIKEVILYRSGLVTAAASFLFASSTAFLNDSEIANDLIRRNLDLLYGLGSCGLGLSLYLIHIYVKEIKMALQALWVIGALGSVATYASLAHPAGKNLVEYVVENPVAIWFVGPLFAALTGLVFKEGLCYGKLEAGVLTFIIPSLLLGHLSGLMDDGAKLALLGVWMALFVVFAGRKFTQPIKDDIGDKSVFIFNALPQEEKAALVEKLEQQNYNQNLN